MDVAKIPRNLCEIHGCLRNFLGNSRILIASCKIFLEIFFSIFRNFGGMFCEMLQKILGISVKLMDVLFLSLSLSLSLSFSRVFLSLGLWRGGGWGGWGGGAHARGARRRGADLSPPPPPQIRHPLLPAMRRLSLSLSLRARLRGLLFGKGVLGFSDERR